MPKGMHGDGEFGITNPQLITAPDKLTISGTSAATSALTVNKRHLFIADTGVYISQGDSTVTADSTDLFWPANFPLEFFTTADDVDNYLAAVQVSAGGFAWVQEL